MVPPLLFLAGSPLFSPSLSLEFRLPDIDMFDIWGYSAWTKFLLHDLLPASVFKVYRRTI